MMAAVLKLLGVLLVLLASITISGCSRSEDQPRAERVATVDPTTKTRTQHPRNVEVPDALEGTGVIRGSVRFIGETIPTSTIVPVGADPQYCGHEYSKEDYMINTDTRSIQYVIVRLRGKRLNDWAYTKPGYLFLDNKNCRFEPHAAVLTVGSTLEVHNSDKILHTVHAYFAASFNFALPKKGVSLKHVLARPGLIQIRCDTHGWMNSFIRVDQHPFHAVTDAKGRFQIVDIPSGTYTLEAWHEQFGTQETEVVVQDHKTLEVDLTYADG